jgi:hypothetical protein
MRTAFFCVIMQRVVVISYDVSGKPIGPILKGQELNLEPRDGTDKLFRNFGSELLLLAA